MAATPDAPDAAAPPGLAAFVRGNAPFLGAGFLLSFTSTYGQTVFVALSAGPVMAAFGLTDGGWGLAYTAATTLSALAMIPAGALGDRIRVRTLGLGVMAGLAGACLLMAAAPNVAVLVLAVFALRFLGQGMTSHLAGLAMARWFTASRGRALAISSLGFAAGQAVLPLLFVAGLARVDWRLLWVAAALLVLLAMPAVRRLLRAERTPQSLAQDPQTTGMGGLHWTRGAMLRHWLFWALVPLLLGPPALGTAFLFHQVHIAAAKGWPLLDYVALLPLLTATTVGATLLSGIALDRVGAALMLRLLALPFALAFALLWGAETLGGAALAFAVFGLGSGMQATVLTAFWAEFYGTRHLGAIKALSTAVAVFGSAVGPGLTGWAIDRGVAFPAQLPALALFMLGAAALANMAVSAAARQRA